MVVTMAYRMTEITETVRVGKDNGGLLHVEFWDRPRSDQEAECVEVIVPFEAASDLGKWLMLNG